jgi:Tannase and feruloyl esterase
MARFLCAGGKAVTFVLLCGLLWGCGGGGSTPAAVVAPTNLASAAQCSELVNSVRDTSVFPPNVAIVSATFTPAVAAVPATGTTPAVAAVAEHCNVIGKINAGRTGAESSPGVTQTYAINFQVRLPTNWNGRFWMSGGGGTDGSIPNTLTNLNDGYATAADDSGHSNATNSDPLAGGSAAFGTDYQARVDFAYNAIDLTTRTAKALIAAYYGRNADYSYFQGCSMGGREAMMVTQRFPSYFDGVVAGDPAFRITKVGVWATYEGQQLASLATSTGLISGNGVPFANNTFTDQDLQLVSNAILTACDSLDGLADGMVSNPEACTTAVVSPVLNALQCSGAKTASCLTSGQITAITNIYTKGAPDSKGVAQYAPWMWDPGIAGCTSATDCNTPTATNINIGWRLWNVGFYNSSFVPNVSTTANGALNFASLGGGAIPLLFATPPILPAPTANDGLANLLMNINFDTLAQSIFGTSAQFPISDTALLNVDDTNLSPFQKHGGKLIVYVGQTGGPFSPQDLVNWYNDMGTAMGGKPQAFARLFLVPGMNHCGGGPATSTFDPFTPVVDWVEKGVAPDSIIGTAPTATPWPGRTRPLCPFPQYAHYNGTGDINDASSFTCQ